MHEGTYTPPTVTVDGVLFQIVNEELTVLLIRRARDPFKGEWALPGGYCAAGETTQQALHRILVAKAGVPVAQLSVVEQLYTFDSIARDPRGHAVSITYMGLGKRIEADGHDKQSPQFFPLGQLPKLAYDHGKIIAYARERLKAKLSHTNIAFALLPPTFTLTQLQLAYEAVLGTPLDKRNFRKKILSLDLIQETEELSREGAHRPARLYTFCQQELVSLASSFE
jgi:8-oxo-dGTP diphosphatase